MGDWELSEILFGWPSFWLGTHEAE